MELNYGKTGHSAFASREIQAIRDITLMEERVVSWICPGSSTFTVLFLAQPEVARVCLPQDSVLS